MKTARTFFLRLPRGEAIEIFADLRRFSEVHPLIESATERESEPGMFEIREQPFLWLPFRTTYQARAEVERPDTVRFLVTGLPLMRAELTFAFVERSASTCDVDVQIEVKGLWGLTHFLGRKMMAAEESVFNELNL